MPVSDGDFEALAARVSRLEDERRLQGRAYAGLDGDVAALQAQRDADRRVLQALRDGQVDQGRELQTLRTELRAGFAAVHAGLEAVAATLARLAPDSGDRYHP